MKTRIAICGYGNLGRGIESQIPKNPDMQLVAIFTRRDPAALPVGATPTVHIADIQNYADHIDVLILCGGSATDLPEQSPQLAAAFNIVDSYDNHGQIPEHMKKVDTAARSGGKTAIISTGWDPGLFSLLRLYTEAILPAGSTASFWGHGVSQGHSDAIRRIDGVADAIQYTIPIEAAVEKAKRGEAAGLSTREKHRRLCYVAAMADADTARIEREIKEMPAYFADYDTDVIFVSKEELKENHARLPHGGCVIRAGETAPGHRHTLEFSLKLDSNPEFTASVLLAYARAAHRLNDEGVTGALNVFDVAPRYLYPGDPAEAVRRLL